MKSFHVYDPALCCSSGVCGPEVDPALVRFAGFLAHLSAAGVAVSRFNLAQQPMAFVLNATVKRLLDEGGVDALPVLLVDGALALKGSYPDEEQCAAWLQAARAGAST